MESNLKSLYYTLQPIPGKGLGAIAITKIPKGRRILSERPLFRWPEERDREQKIRMVEEIVAQLSEEQGRQFYSLKNSASNRYSSRSMGIAATNSFSCAPQAYSAICLEASRFNHSCKPNATWMWREDLFQMTIHTIKEIKEGEEITICYIENCGPYPKRQQTLTSFGFTCTCELCSLPPDARDKSDGKRRRIDHLKALIEDQSRFSKVPAAWFRSARELSILMKEERMRAEDFDGLYQEAFHFAIRHGDQARARAFALRSYVITIICFGGDHPIALRLKKYAIHPSSYPMYGESMRWKQDVDRIPKNLDEDDFEAWLWRCERKDSINSRGDLKDLADGLDGVEMP